MREPAGAYGETCLLQVSLQAKFNPGVSQTDGCAFWKIESTQLPVECRSVRWPAAEFKRL